MLGKTAGNSALQRNMFDFPIHSYLGVHFACLIVGYRHHSRRGDETPQAPAEREGAAKAHACAESGHGGAPCPLAMSLATSCGFRGQQSLSPLSRLQALEELAQSVPNRTRMRQ